MNTFRSHLVLSVLAACGALSSVACDDGGTDPVTPPNGGTAGAPAGVAGAPNTNGKSAGVTVKPDATGWVDAAAEGNTVGVQGAWYPYGDAYGDEKTCITAGHTPDECSKITTPDPTAMKFDNVDGKMCTSGSTGKVLNGADGMPDWSNMWGAGIGLDLNALGAEQGGTKMPFDAAGKGITGIGFTVTTPPASFRVEFPIPETEGHKDGSAYWGASGTFPPSPVKEGWNEVRWANINQPNNMVPFNPAKILAVQFHVFASNTARNDYSFCISDLTFLTQ